MQSLQPALPTRRPAAPITSPERLRTLYGAVVTALGLLGIFFVVRARGLAQSVVVFDNTHDFRVLVKINDEARATIEPRKHLRLELPAGGHRVVVAGPGGTVDSGSFDLEPSVGRAVYVIGSERRLALVTKSYGSDASGEMIEVLPEGRRFVPLPAQIEDIQIDDPFPDSVNVPVGAHSAQVVHLCHVDPATKRPTC
jgi:hypothetical protein